MKLIIYRGTHEIGGLCVKLTSSGSRIILDIGMPLVEPGRDKGCTFDFCQYQDLPGPELVERGRIPAVRGLYFWDDSPPVDALLVSHAHHDHYGFASIVKKEIPLLASKVTVEFMQISALFLPDIKPVGNHQVFDPWKEVTVGGFTIKPHLVDHSAPDALAFEISSNGKRVFYSGDIREIGGKSKLFDNMLKRPPVDIEELLLEGTMLSRLGPHLFLTCI